MSFLAECFVKFPSDMDSRSSTFTDFCLAITASGAYYFDENDSLGIGLNIGVGIFFNLFQSKCGRN